MFSGLTRKNLFDKGFLWKKPMLSALENINFKKPIDILVVTGGPFSLLYYGTLFKRKYNKIKYIADFRDPWTWGDLYGIPKLKQKQKKFQHFSEFKTLKYADVVTYPTESMGDFLKKEYSEFSSKLYLLPHAYDPDKFLDLNDSKERKGFIYGGTIYNGLEKLFVRLEKIINENSKSNFNWVIYTGTNYPMFEKNFANGKVQKMSFIPEKELFEKIKSSAAYLVFFSESQKDLISTKFYEIIYTQTPIIFIGAEGAVGKFIRESRIGVHILPENMEKELPKYFDQSVPFEKDYLDVRKYSFPVVTENFVEYLNKTPPTHEPTPYHTI
jgi:glycosyltransferase involved in cell wall biosynthesis